MKFFEYDFQTGNIQFKSYFFLSSFILILILRDFRIKP